MEEKEFVREKVREIAGDPETAELAFRIIDDAYRGLEEGLSEGVVDKVKERLDAALREIEKLADEIRETI
ncbi:hypothetical protein [Candidatus Solincola tengchongensis]|uniref:hypothetical protein n=1 Tax=Candidatus Solincola tengchongensis TaxID=2900693 RepID=UPI00257CCAA5|nr:hypothetical protein [Candidatus Solincola tengchongensis]